jgi:hypothetical protein
MLFSNARDSFVISNNSFYSNTGNILLNAALQSLVWPTTVGTIDSNYYANPWDDSQSFNVNATHYYNLSGWQTLSGKDLHSQNVPSGVNKWPVKFLVNSLSIPQTFRILGTYIAVNGTSYNNYVTLQPYQSITLIKATVNDGTAYPPSSLPLFITKITQL